MTMQEYQQKVLELTEEFLGPIAFSYKNPFKIQMMLPHQANCTMKLIIGFHSDVTDE